MGNISTYHQRQMLFDDLSKNNTENKVKIINGKYKGKTGQILRVGNIKNNTYNKGKNKYHNYFDLTILIDSKNVVTSCRNIKY